MSEDTEDQDRAEQAAARQRRGTVIAMTAAEREGFLAAERVCRVATVGGDGAPHVSPLWFAWHGGALWLFSITRSQRWRDLERDPRVSVVIDAGVDYFELRGVEVSGRAAPVGENPRGKAGDPDFVDDPDLAAVEQIFADKYMGGTFYPDGRHAWLKITPEKIASWDFRKLAALGKGPA